MCYAKSLIRVYGLYNQLNNTFFPNQIILLREGVFLPGTSYEVSDESLL